MNENTGENKLVIIMIHLVQDEITGPFPVVLVHLQWSRHVDLALRVIKMDIGLQHKFILLCYTPLILWK